MGYIFNSMMREYERNRRATLKARANQRAEKATAIALRRLVNGVRCPKCWQEAYAAKVVPVVPANAGVRLRALPQGTPVPPAVLCTLPGRPPVAGAERAASAPAAGTQGQMKAHARIYEEGGKR